jgi:glycosyltransferase involved in cell wall biosynthesis
MHILLIHQNFAALDEPGGTRHHELARFLVERGHQVTVITSPISYLTGGEKVKRPGSPSREERPGIKIIRTYTYPALHRSFFHRVLSFLSFMASSFFTGLRIKKVDIIWGTSPPIFQGLTALCIARIKRIPFVFEVRDLWPAFAVAVGILRQPLLIKLSEWLETFLYRNADQTLVNSPGFVSHVETRGGKQVQVVPNGADPAMFASELAGGDFFIKQGIQSQFIALYAGAHGMSNDLQVILHAADRLRHRQDISFVLLGDGKDKPLLIKKAEEMGLDNLKFLPPVPKMDMGKALAGSGACIAILKPVNLYATVYPNKVFDYMAAGKPVVLAIGGVIRDVIEDARAGIAVAPGNNNELAEAVCWLADHPQEAEQMGKRGRDYVEKHFDRAELARKLERIFTQLVKT